jgi:peptidoglycan/LPS O-acetylase OafA/YrhL
MPQQREILPLTGIRGLAALWVVAMHLGFNLQNHGVTLANTNIERNLLQGGNLAVDVFFILSGYVLMLSYEERIDIPKFLVHRIARIYPLHIFVLSLMVIGVIALRKLGFQFNPVDGNFFDFHSLPFQFLLIFVWFGMPLAWNGPTWSLSAEIGAYLFFPLIRSLIKQLRPRHLQFLVSVLILLQIGFLTIMGFEVTGAGAIVRAFLGFSLGMSLRLLQNHPLFSSAKSANILAVVLITLIAAGFPGLAALPAALLILVLANPAASFCHRFLSGVFVVWLGRISYSIYLIHTPTLLAFLEILKHFHHLESGLGLAIFIVSYVGMVLLAASITYHVIEIPSRTAIQGAWKWKRQQRIPEALS